MEMKDLLSVIDSLQQEKQQPEIIVESKNELQKRIDILSESTMDEKISFHHTGNISNLKRHLKQSHGLSKAIRKSSSKGAKHFLKDETNPSDSVTMDIPLLIRLLEYAREDAQDDMDLHNVAEKLIQLSADGEILTMDAYDSIVGGQSEEPSEI